MEAGLAPGERQARLTNRAEAAMTASAEERIRQLTAGMLRKQLHVILWKGNTTPDRLRELLPMHLEFMIDLEKRGILFASGPLDGGARGDGLTILRAPSLDEAKQIANRDPFVVNGLRTFEVREWTVMEGSLHIKVNFSDQSLELA
jgi:uncharacterized protein YciI